MNVELVEQLQLLLQQPNSQWVFCGITFGTVALYLGFQITARAIEDQSGERTWRLPLAVGALAMIAVVGLTLLARESDRDQARDIAERLVRGDFGVIFDPARDMVTIVSCETVTFGSETFERPREVYAMSVDKAREINELLVHGGAVARLVEPY